MYVRIYNIIFTSHVLQGIFVQVRNTNSVEYRKINVLITGYNDTLI